MIVGDAFDAVDTGLVTNALNSGTYYLYERLWSHVGWSVSGAG